MNTQTLAQNVLIRANRLKSKADARRFMNLEFTQWYADMQTNPAKYLEAMDAHAATLPPEEIALMRELWELIQLVRLPVNVFTDDEQFREADNARFEAWREEVERRNALDRITPPFFDHLPITLTPDEYEAVHGLAQGGEHIE